MNEQNEVSAAAHPCFHPRVGRSLLLVDPDLRKPMPSLLQPLLNPFFEQQHRAGGDLLVVRNEGGTIALLVRDGIAALAEVLNQWLHSLSLSLAALRHTQAQ